jgi:hypothetical protein
MSLKHFYKNNWKTRPICPHCNQDMGIGDYGTYLYDYCKHCNGRITVLKQNLKIFNIEKDGIKS